MTEEEILAFATARIASQWELELLLLLQRTAPRRWSTAELVRELRASRKVVSSAVEHLKEGGMLMTADDAVFYAASTEDVGAAVSALRSLCTTKPFTVLNAIARAAKDPLKSFSDAFRIKE